MINRLRHIHYVHIIIRPAQLLAMFTILLSTSGAAQTVCATANENASLTITAPPGQRFSAVEFASYGTPTGTCATYAQSGCHSATSMSVCSTAIVNQTTATITASNGVFGDPCVGTVKRLYVRARYEAILPLTLTAFSARQINETQVLFQWSTEDEVNTQGFTVEQSNDGINFKHAAYVPAAGSGKHSYSFTANTSAGAMNYYRLKMSDRDGQFTYSHVVRVTNEEAQQSIEIIQDAQTQTVAIKANQKEELWLMNYGGQVIKKLTIMPGTQIINFSGISSGIYILRSRTTVTKLLIKNR